MPPSGRFVPPRLLAVDLPAPPPVRAGALHPTHHDGAPDPAADSVLDRAARELASGRVLAARDLLMRNLPDTAYLTRMQQQRRASGLLACWRAVKDLPHCATMRYDKEVPRYAEPPAEAAPGHGDAPHYDAGCDPVPAPDQPEGEGTQEVPGQVTATRCRCCRSVLAPDTYRCGICGSVDINHRRY